MKFDKLGIIILVLPFIAAAVALFFLPDNIPLQFSITGQVNRYGSKYYLLLFALIPFIVYQVNKNKRKDS
jgi:uncharacterized membrane protein